MHTAATHLEGAFLSRLFAVTFQHLPVDPQAEDLRRDLVVVRHRVPLELQLTAGRCEVSEAAAQTLVRTGWIRGLLLLVLVHFDLRKNATAAQRKIGVSQKQRYASTPVYKNSVIPSRTSRRGTQPNETERGGGENSTAIG